jgi:hypothetical protein
MIIRTVRSSVFRPNREPPLPRLDSAQILSLQGYDEIQNAIIALLEAARHTAARSINALMTATYWEIGRRIVEFEQGGTGRAAYGEALIEQLSEDLTRRFGRGFSRQNLGQMRAFYRTWPAERICQTPSGKSLPTDILRLKSPELQMGSTAQRLPGEGIELAALAKVFPLPWSAYVRLLSVRNKAARLFYETEALRCGWSVRQLDRQVSSQFYERTALSKNKAAMLENAETPEPVMTLRSSAVSADCASMTLGFASICFSSTGASDASW